MDLPEGDTIFRTAHNLRAAIEGHPVSASESRDASLSAERIVDRTITCIEARGKHLLMHLDESDVLHSHMGMTGSWHLYQPGEPWNKPPRRAALSFTCHEVVAVCFSPKTLELLSRTAFRRHRHLRRLGPDILSSSFRIEEVLPRFRLHNEAPLGEAILNQTILCGLGNVYKSEVLFLARSNPFLPVRAFSDQQITAILEIAHDLIRRNLEGYPRRTRFSGDAQRQWVYGRKGEPCFECGEPVDMKRQGDMGRSTYWCGRCQS